MKTHDFYEREIEDTFTHYNIQRTMITSIILLFLHVILYMDTSFFIFPIYSLGSYILIALSIVYLIFYFCFYKQHLKYCRKYMYLYFWGILCIGFIPYIVKDILSLQYPVYMTLCYGLLMAIPILNTKEALSLFIVFGSSNLFLCFYYHASIYIYLYTLFLTIMGLFVSYFIQHQYTVLISRLKYQCDNDYLTGILNRRGGIEKIKQLLSICKRHHIILGVCMIDVDFFKDYNDFYGHIQGDLALQQVAACFKKTMQRENDMVCRFGGEEFLICFTCDKVEEIECIANKLKEAIATLEIPCCFYETLPNLTISVGTSGYFPDIDTHLIEELSIIKKADDALYYAKRNGRNQIFHSHTK